MKVTTAEISVMSAEHQCAKLLINCKQQVQIVQSLYDEWTRREKEVSEMYNKVLFAATNGQYIFQSAVTVLRTASEVLSASNELVHSLRQFSGETHVPFRLSSNLSEGTKTIEQRRRVCRLKKVTAVNSSELSTLTERVSEMKSFIEKSIEPSVDGNAKALDEGKEDDGGKKRRTANSDNTRRT